MDGNGPSFYGTRLVAPDTFAFTSWLPLPGLGILNINSWLLRSRQPVLVDTGMPIFVDKYMSVLKELIDPADIEWIWLTHCDIDHIGAVRAVLAAAPRAKVVTNYIGFGKLGISGPIPPERMFLLNPGQALDVGDRLLHATPPPIFDAPETMALFDDRTRVLFSADSFGAVLPRIEEEANDIGGVELRDGMVLWATADSPWIRFAEKPALAARLDVVSRLDPLAILSSHLPPAFGLTETFLGHLAEARDAPPFVGPDQAAMMAMMQPPQPSPVP